MAILNVHQSSAMTTSSMAVDDFSEAHIEKTIQKMKANLIRYARGNDRRMVLRSLKDVKLLQCLSLDIAQPTEGPVFDLEKEVAEESIIFNGVTLQAIQLGGHSGVKDQLGSAVRHSAIPMLKGLCREFCERVNVNASSREVYEKLIVRLAKTTSSADPYFRLNSFLGSPDLLVMPFNDSTGQSFKNSSLIPGLQNSESKPAELNMYESNGDIHMRLTQTFKFGLFRKADVKSNLPWMIIEGVVNERANLSNNESVRQLKVVLPQIY